MALLLSCRAVRKSYGDKVVLSNVFLDIAEGERIGLVGRNGAGKTTLANILFGSLDYDAGTILRLRDAMTIGYLLQSASYAVNTVPQDAGDAHSGLLETASRLGLRKVYEWDDARFAGLSGGERTKLALAEVWASKPHLLLLDEPTNHMDFAGVEWLLSELEGYAGTALIISHDRYFLDRIAGRIVELEDGEATSFAGNYTAYRDEKARRRAGQITQYENHKKQQAKVEEEIARINGWAQDAHRESREMARQSGGRKEFYRTKAKKLDRQVKSRIKRLERLKTEGVERPKDEARVEFGFKSPDKRGRRILEARGIAKGYGGRLLFDDSSFFVQRGDRIGLIGPNGCGKTTLLRALLGQEALDGGELWLSGSARVGYLSQDADKAPSDVSALQLLQALPAEAQAKARTTLANMGIGADMLRRPFGQWSLGERTRFEIARLVLQGCDLLVLDEPTNHLDLPSREELEAALEQYEGAVLLVSHDRYMLDRICRELLVFENGTIRKVPCGFSDWVCAAKDPSDETAEIRGGAEERMRVENRLAVVLAELGRAVPGTSEYALLDGEFVELCRIKNRLCADAGETNGPNPNR